MFFREGTVEHPGLFINFIPFEKKTSTVSYSLFICKNKDVRITTAQSRDSQQTEDRVRDQNGRMDLRSSCNFHTWNDPKRGSFQYFANESGPHYRVCYPRSRSAQKVRPRTRRKVQERCVCGQRDSWNLT